MSKEVIYKGNRYDSLFQFFKENEEDCEVSYSTLLNQYSKNGFPIEKAIKKQSRKGTNYLDEETNSRYKDYLIENQYKKNTEIADHLGLSRERIRQLRIKYNIPKVRSPNPKIIEIIFLKIKNGEATLGDPLPHKMFKDLDIGKKTFSNWVDNDPELKSQIQRLWEESVDKKTNYTEKICTDCKEMKPLEDFYIDNKARTIDGKARRCIQCTKDTVEKYYIERNIEKPTVKFKICKVCKKNKEFFEYYRSTHSNSGLQSTCITCHDKQTVLSRV